MKSILTILGIVILFSSCLFAQAPDTLWTKTYGGEGIGFSVQQTTDGGYIITGTTNNDVWLIKTNESGDTLWTKTFGGEDSEWGESVRQTNDGGYIITGHTKSFGSGDNDVWLIKTDETGDTLWTKTYGGENRERGESVHQTTDNGYILVGFTESFGSGSGDVWLIKTDETGDTLWTKTFGGENYDCGYSVRQTTDGGYIITGQTKSFGLGDNNIWLIKTDSMGDTLWTRTYCANYDDWGMCIKQTTDSGYIITGVSGYWFHRRESSIWLIKTNSIGDTLWTKMFGDSGWCIGTSIQQTSDGGYFLTGVSDYNGIWLIKTDSNGNTKWLKNLLGYAHDGSQTTDGGYIIAGSNDDRLWLIKLAAEPVDYLSPDQNELPEKYELSQNYPNPFNPLTVICWQLPVSSHVDLSIYNVLGQKVVTLVNEKQSGGNYQVQWDATGFATGVYYYKIEAGEYSEVKKMILIR